MTKLWPSKVGVKTGELQQRRNVAESAETEHPNIAMLPNDVVTFGVGFGSFYSPLLGVLKLKPEGDGEERFGEVWKGGNTLGHGSLWGRR